MQTIIALPSSAATRSSKCFTRSSATSARRFSEPTSASTLAHLRLSRSCSVCGLVLGQVGDFGVDLRLLVLVEFDARQPALVVDRHGRAVLDRAADVVDVDVVAEHGGRVHVVLLDRRAGEADEGGVGQARRAGIWRSRRRSRRSCCSTLASKPYWLRCASSAITIDVAAVGQQRIVGRRRLRARISGWW